MTPRLNPVAAAAASMKAWLDFSTGAHEGLDAGLLELIKIRSSQLNSCAGCLDIHVKAARELGETEERIYLLNAWRECALYTPRERAALAWTEALTLVATERAPDDVYAELKANFTDEEQVKLTLIINVINGWNRIAIGFNLGPTSRTQRAAAWKAA
ncbi:MAG: carboxymuconolactone decarboxylase family protein [Mesorhizobium sp.]